MVEKKTKTSSTKKTIKKEVSSSSKKSEKKTVTPKKKQTVTKKVVSSTKKPMPEIKEISSSLSSKSFSKGNLTSYDYVSSKPDKKVPLWMIIVFLFSLVFFLFSLYKVFIYGKGYDFSEKIHLPLWTQSDQVISIDPSLLGDDSLSPSSVEETWVQSYENEQDDISVIQNFYTALANNEIEEMNEFVDRPLRNSTTRTNHRNKKNIQIFTKNLSETVLLQDLFLIPGSVNEEKKTKQYSYTLHYTIKPEKSFDEDWQITLITHGDKTLISEIMCKTQGCSRSPFFWPQNYGLK